MTTLTVKMGFNCLGNKEEAWNEIEEAHCSLTTLSISEIEECREAITNRLEKAMKLLEEKEDG